MPKATWDALVLPAAILAQLRDICTHIAQRNRVLYEWGFDAKLSSGKGLTALFVGPSGTGKTLAAEVITRELGVELLRVHLPAVVSKYIGETEKNLSRIFEEAEHGDAILFFDEADALFGKRSEVRDAHDRYANIEINYLLQRLDEFEGAAILATNLAQNMDESFTRRIHLTVEFPFPDATLRAKIWRAHIPPAVPVAPDLNTDALARLPIAGGNIRNVVWNAAFLAAGEDTPLAMRHLLRAAQREYDKMGKLYDESEFTANAGKAGRR